MERKTQGWFVSLQEQKRPRHYSTTKCCTQTGTPNNANKNFLVDPTLKLVFEGRQGTVSSEPRRQHSEIEGKLRFNKLLASHL
jgi:hypothetical protein